MQTGDYHPPAFYPHGQSTKPRRNSIDSTQSEKSYVSIRSWQNKGGYLEERTEINLETKQTLLKIKKLRQICVVSAILSILASLLALPLPAYWTLQGYYVSGIIDYFSLLSLIGSCVAVIYFRQSLNHNKMLGLFLFLFSSMVISLVKMVAFHVVFGYFFTWQFGIVICVDTLLFLVPMVPLLVYVRQLIAQKDVLRAFGYILNSMTRED
jgi:hypothetical protein